MISTCDNRMVVAPPEGRALWLFHNGASLHLMASTSLTPARLTLAVQNCFDATVLRVDVSSKRLFIRPSANDDEYSELCYFLKQCSLVKLSNSTIKLSCVYLCLVGENIIRGVVAKVVNPNQSYLVYGIDVGAEFLVSVQDFYELNTELRDIPPLCICVVLSACPMLDSCEEFASLMEGSCCVCSLDKMYPSVYPEKVKKLYPPAIVSHLYRKDGSTGKFETILCTSKEVNKDINLNIVGDDLLDNVIKREQFDNFDYLYSKRRISKSDLHSSLVFDGKVLCPNYDSEFGRFQFPKYRVHLPFIVNVLITRKIAFATYIMRDTYIITKVQAHMKHPCNPLMVDSRFFKATPCIARVKRLKDSSLELYRAVLLQRSPGSSACLVYLVDYGQRVNCDYDQLFDLQDQPPVILESPIASFKCRVRRVFKQKGLKVNKLIEEVKYRICLTLKCTSKTYWGVVLPHYLMYGDVSFEDMEDCSKNVYSRTTAKKDCNTNSAPFHRCRGDVSEEETQVSAIGGEEDDDFSDNDDDNQGFRFLQAKAESVKYCENMSLLSVMLQQLSCRVDAMEILAGCDGWNTTSSVFNGAYGCNQPPPYPPLNPVSSVAAAGTQGIRFPVAYIPQFNFNPSFPPPPTSLPPHCYPHFQQLQNRAVFEQFPPFISGRRVGDKCDVECQRSPSRSENLIDNIVHEKCIYKSECATAGLSCCENHEVKAGSNVPATKNDFDSWESPKSAESYVGDSLHDMNQVIGPRAQASSRCFYANALKKGLHVKGRGKASALSNGEKKTKVRNVIR